MEPHYSLKTPSRPLTRRQAATPVSTAKTQSKDEYIAQLKETNARLLGSYKDAQSASQYLASILGYSDHVEARMSLEMLGAEPGSISYGDWLEKTRESADGGIAAIAAEEGARLEDELLAKDQQLATQAEELERLRFVFMRLSAPTW